MTQLGAYVHIPFCERKCPYCDFNSYAGMDQLAPAYVNALCAEMRAARRLTAGRRVDTVFVGGGTPTLLGTALLRQVMSGLQSSVSLAEGAEITFEANPGTVDRSRFVALRELGVTRLSIGVQSFDDGELSFLGRVHSARQAVEAFDAARSAGFDNISLDLMFGLPDQSLEVWRRSLGQAVSLEPEHLSLYNLTVEAGTPLARSVAAGSVVPLPEDDAAVQFEEAMAVLADSGYVHYEVSNWARHAPRSRDHDHVETSGMDLPVHRTDSPVAGLYPSFTCRHNLMYWHNGCYVGFGPGAHSHSRVGLPHHDSWESASAEATSDEAVAWRWANVNTVPEYVAKMMRGESVVAFEESLDVRVSMGETMMLGLRLLVEGVRHERFRQLHHADLREAYASQLAELSSSGLIEVDDERTRMTPSGLMVGNRVFEQFVQVD